MNNWKSKFLKFCSTSVDESQKIPKKESQSDRSNADKFVEMVNVNMDEHAKETRHDLLDTGNVVTWKRHA